MQMMFRPRLGNLAGFLACCGLMGFALYVQHGLGLEPCPLCVFQRVAVIGLGLIFLAAAAHDAAGFTRKVYGMLIALISLGGAAVAGRHVWLQSLPPDQVPACGPGLDFMLETFAFIEVLEMVLSGSGECAEVVWSFLGLSMPAWVLICVLALGSFGVLVNWGGVGRDAEI